MSYVETAAIKKYYVAKIINKSITIT